MEITFCNQDTESTFRNQDMESTFLNMIDLLTEKTDPWKM